MKVSGAVAIVLILALASLVPVIWAIVDVSRRPAWQFSTGRKVIWAISLGLGWVIFWPIALISSLVYLTVIRRRFPQAPAGPGTGPMQGGGGYGAGYGYGGGYGYRPPPPAPPPPPLPPAGWYPDPGGSGGQRWWDGRGWTEHVR